jgi:hypothetical protein
MSLPLMPKATAVWLIENTTLTFKQIAQFCGMHELEIKGIADGEVAQGIRGMSPLTDYQLLQEEIDRCQKDHNATLKMSSKVSNEGKEKKSKSKYTPIARRQDKPDAILWLIKNYPSVSDSKVAKLIGTTKNMIESLRNKEHWNMANIRPRDPVLLGICSQTQLNKLIADLEDREEGERE